MRRGLLTLAAPFLLLSLCAGCNWLTAFAYYFSPERTEPAQFVLSKAPLAIVIDGAPSGDDHPLLRRALHRQIVELFEQNGVNDQVIPYARQLDLQQANPDFAQWPLQRIGRKLGAAQVIHLQIVQFQLRESPDFPMLQPLVRLHVRVIDTHAPAREARLWPPGRGGHEIEVTRHASEVGGYEATDAEVVKLGKDAGQWVARLFYDYSLEEPVPVEP